MVRFLAFPSNVRLGSKKLAKENHSSLLQKFANYGQIFFVTLTSDVLQGKEVFEALQSSLKASLSLTAIELFGQII